MGRVHLGRILCGLAVAGVLAGCASMPPAPKLDGQSVVIDTPLGTDFNGYVTGPQDAQRAILLVNAYWGFNTELEQEADRYGAQGYRVLAIDVFDGRASKDPHWANLIVSQIDQEWVDVDLRAAVDYLYKPGRKVITYGWGYGGAQALRAAELVPGKVAGTIMYYGLPVTEARTATSRQPVDPNVLLTHPHFATEVPILQRMRGRHVLAIFARHDPWITEQDVEKFSRAVHKAGLGLWLIRMDAKRGFYDPLSDGYSETAAQAARNYTKQFLAKALGPGGAS